MGDYLEHKIARNSITGGAPRGRQTPSVFIAYHFGHPDSEAFRARLELEFQSPKVHDRVKVLDGRVEAGKTWTTEIRKRLQRSWIVVSDLTVIRPDVLFECGLAWGARRFLCTVVKDQQAWSNLPEWMTDQQNAFYESESNWHSLMEHLWASLGNQRQRPKPVHRVPPPDPNDCLLLCKADADPLIKGKVEAMAQRNGMRFKILDPSSASLNDDNPETVNAIGSASLLVAHLNGTSDDFFSFFAAGLVVAKPTAGASKSKLQRKMVFLLDNAELLGTIPGAARKSRSSICYCEISALDRELKSFSEKLSSWKGRLDKASEL